VKHLFTVLDFEFANYMGDVGPNSYVGDKKSLANLRSAKSFAQ
jgi:hypothetical protein